LWAALSGLLLLSQAGAASAQADPQPVYLRVYVPADAKVMIEGVATKQTGDTRRFVSPPLAALPAGKKYAYTVKATFTLNGKEETREKTINVEPGKEFEVDLRLTAEAKKDAEPKKETEPKKDAEPKKDPVIPKPADPKKDTPPVAKKDDEKTIVVPYVPTPEKVVEAMLKMADVKEGDVVYDLGCGDGRIVITAVKQFKAKKGFGLDLNPERVKDSYENAKKAGVEKQVEFKQGDVLKLTDVSEANVVTLYLLPEVNLKLMPMLKKTLKPGSRVVSHDFDMGEDWKPEKSQKIEVDGIEHDVFLWTIPAKKDGKK
jgi:uncharacterized protein (TIGR03000 family)